MLSTEWNTVFHTVHIYATITKIYQKNTHTLCYTLICLFYFFNFFLKILFIYSFMIDTHTQRGRDTGGGRSRLHGGSPTWDSILGSPGSYPGSKAALNPWATGAALFVLFLKSQSQPAKLIFGPTNECELKFKRKNCFRGWPLTAGARKVTELSFLPLEQWIDSTGPWGVEHWAKGEKICNRGAWRPHRTTLSQAWRKQWLFSQG